MSIFRPVFLLLIFTLSAIFFFICGVPLGIFFQLWLGILSTFCDFATYALFVLRIMFIPVIVYWLTVISGRCILARRCDRGCRPCTPAVLSLASLLSAGACLHLRYSLPTYVSYFCDSYLLTGILVLRYHDGTCIM